MQKISPKIIRSPRRYGYALIPKLIINYRTKVGPRNLVVRDFGTIRSYLKNDETTRRKFWLDLSMELIRLKTTGRIGASDVERICTYFENEFPRVGLVSTPAAKPDQTTRAELLAKFPFLAGAREGA